MTGRRPRSVARKLLGVAVMSLSVVACGSGDGVGELLPPVNSDPTVAAVSISPDSTLLTELGATQQFSATAVDDNGGALTGIDFQWSSSDQSVASVTDGGLATAEGDGEGMIVVEADGEADTAAVVVNTNPEILSVTVTPSSVTIEEGETVTLSASVEAEEGADTSVTWSSSNSSVASVNASGNVTGQSTGSATIVANSNADASKSGAAEVTVTEL